MVGTSVVIVGGGASAVHVAVALGERAAARGVAAPRVTVVSREPEVGRGLAYGRADAHHRLNSPAGKMSVSAADDSHFLRWLASRGEPAEPGDFVPRRLYGDYLQDVYEGLADGPDASVRTVVAEAVAVATDDRGAHVTLDDGTVIDADVAVLALGNPPPVTWPTGAAVQVADPWAVGALDRVPAGASVLLVGTGLTMVDVATSLARRDPDVRITATSRHLMLPGVHTPSPVPAGPGLDPSLTALGDLAHDLREQLDAATVSGDAWQGVIDGMRPRLMDHWTGLSVAERRRFVTHFARRWDTHRHRMAVSVHDELQGLIGAGRLAFVAGADPASFDAVVFCTGPGALTTRGWSPVVDGLLDAGRIGAEPVGLGPVADAAGSLASADGSDDGRLLGIGHALRGALWETTAIGEIRIMAGRVADRALDVVPVASAA